MIEIVIEETRRTHKVFTREQAIKAAQCCLDEDLPRCAVCPARDSGLTCCTDVIAKAFLEEVKHNEGNTADAGDGEGNKEHGPLHREERLHDSDAGDDLHPEGDAAGDGVEAGRARQHHTDHLDIELKDGDAGTLCAALINMYEENLDTQEGEELDALDDLISRVIEGLEGPDGKPNLFTFIARNHLADTRRIRREAKED